MPIYLKLSTITGESKAKRHVGWIELTSLSLSSTREVKNKISEVKCTKNMDSTSATLMRLSVSGKPQPATVDFVDAEGKIYLQLQLENVLIASYSLSGGAGGRPSESMTLNFTGITIVKFSADVPDDAGTLLQDLLSAPTP